jgi:hypothetical protein
MMRVRELKEAKETRKRDLSKIQREKEVRLEIRLKVQEDYYSIMEEEQNVKKTMKLKE